MKSWAEEYDDDDIPMLAEKLLSWLDGEKAIVPDIGIKLTNKCSLNCKHCIDRIPYLPNTDVPIETVKRDLEILLDNAVYVGLLTFVSGEVLVYPHLAEVLKIAVESPKVHKILINTNGTVLPRESSVPYLKSPKCSIYISDYGDLVKMARAVDFYERNGIDILVRTEMKWKPYSAYPEKRGKDIGALKKMFASCSIANACPPLMSDGRAAICGIAEKFRELGAYTGTRDFFDLSREGKFKENYYRMMSIDYMECCDMCDIVELGNSTEYVTAGEQIDPKKQWHRSSYTISKRYEGLDGCQGKR